MSIQIIEIRQFQGPATVELSGVGVPEIVEVRQGPAGVNGPNSVTSATTSDGTCDLSVFTLDATQGIGAGLNPTSGRSITANGGDGTGIYVSATSGTGLLIEVDTGIALDVTSNTGNDIATFRDELNNGLNIENPRGWITWVYEPSDIYLGRLKTDDITANREWTLPDRTGNIALTEDYTAGTATIDVLNATVQGTLTAAHIHGNIAGSVYAHVRAGENLAKGDPVYISGSHGTGANLIAIVSKADASNAAKMPAVGVMDAAVSNNANGHMVITGTISDIDTNAYAVNSVLYVASGGGWTSTPPAANSQPVAIVERSNTNNGAVIVKVNGLASSGGNGASDANKLVRYPSAGSTGSGAIVQATSPTLTSPTLTGTPNFTATNYTFASDARIGFLNSLSNRFVYKNGLVPYAEIFDDFPQVSNGIGSQRWVSNAGTIAYYSPASSSSSSRFFGAISMLTAASANSAAQIYLQPTGGATGPTTSPIGMSMQACFCVSSATASEFRLSIGMGITVVAALLFGTGVLHSMALRTFL